MNVVFVYILFPCFLSAREEHEGGGDAPQVPLLPAGQPRHPPAGQTGGAQELHPRHPPQDDRGLGPRPQHKQLPGLSGLSELPQSPGPTPHLESLTASGTWSLSPGASQWPLSSGAQEEDVSVPDEDLQCLKVHADRVKCRAGSG